MQKSYGISTMPRGAVSIGAMRFESRPLLAAAGLFVIAFCTRVALLHQPPQFDELYHVLAAKGWLATGTFRIADGTYDRARLFTLLVAGMFRLFGQAIDVARFPSVLFGAMLVPAIFLWTRAVAGWPAALVAGGLAIAWPNGIELSETARFYALQGLLFWLGAIGVYRLATRPIARGPGITLSLGVAVAFVLAIHLQITTLIGLVALGSWATLFVLLPIVWQMRSRWLVLGGGVVFGLALLAIGIATGILPKIWSEFRFAVGWAKPARNFVRYYLVNLTEQYPAVFPLLPLVAIVAAAYRSRPAPFCSMIFLVSLTIHSFAGMKDMRYIYYIMPFFFALTGIAVQAAWAPVARALISATRTAVAAATPTVRPQSAHTVPPAHLIVVWSILAIAGLFAVATTPAVLDAVKLASGRPLKPAEDWERARPALAPWLGKDSLVLTGDEMHALFALGRYDVLVNRSRRSEMTGQGAFTIDPRTGYPVVDAPKTVAALIDCSHRGIYIDRAWAWNGTGPYTSPVHDAVVDGEVKDLSPVHLPPGTGLVALSWEHTPATGPKCDRIRELARLAPAGQNGG